MARPKGGVVLVDGPAAGRYSVRRAPVLLRAVVSIDGADQPLPGERVAVYELDPSEPHVDPDAWTRAHHVILCPTPGASGTYRHRADVDGEALRTTEAWRAWARAQVLPMPAVDGVTLEPRP